MNRGPRKVKGLPNLVFQVPFVGEVHQLWIVNKDNKGRWGRCHLRRVKDPQTLAVLRWRRVGSNRVHNNVVQNRRLDPPFVVGINLFNHFRQLVQALLGLGRYKNNRRIGQVLLLVTDRVGKVGHRPLVTLF